MADIYESIWDDPAGHVSVSRRVEGAFDNPGADVLLDEQGPVAACSGQGTAPRPLLAGVREAVLGEPTFETFIALLDNYTAKEGQAEKPLTDPDHRPQVDAFLDAVLPTGPMMLAVDYVRQELRPGMTAAQFRDQVRALWFEPFTNKFSAPEPFCVGFEHVFVGEDEAGPGQPPRCADNIGGYHSWVAYYLDQQAGRTTYLGHDYEGPVAAQGLADPNVATVLMTWKPDGNGRELLKKPGGFFVGTRPEVELALGTVGQFEHLTGRFQHNPGTQGEDHRRVKFGESFFDLVIHPQALRRTPRENGPHLRTIFPKFRGGQDPGGGGGEPSGPGLIPTHPHNSGALRIARALPNPPGPEDEGEWVEVRNISTEDFDLSAWRMRDRLGRSQAMSGVLAAGQTRQFVLDRSPGGMQLGNAGGWILLFEGDQRRAAVRYGQAAQGQVFTFS